MQNQGRISRLIVLIFLNVIVLALAVAVINFTYAEQIKPGLHTLYYLANKQSSKQIAHITVGKRPSAIGVDFNLNKIYVVNTGDNTVSVIDATNNTNIWNIPVGESLEAIDVDAYAHKVYVANFISNTVSVIDGTNNTNIKNIAVGRNPAALKVFPPEAVARSIFVVNTGDKTVSVIDATNNTNIKNIPVGRNPAAIGVNPNTNTIYVVNNGEHSVSVIDSQAIKVLARVIFNIEPFNTGYIVCDKSSASTRILFIFWFRMYSQTI